MSRRRLAKWFLKRAASLEPSLLEPTVLAVGDIAGAEQVARTIRLADGEYVVTGVAFRDGHLHHVRWNVQVKEERKATPI